VVVSGPTVSVFSPVDDHLSTPLRPAFLVFERWFLLFWGACCRVWVSLPVRFYVLFPYVSAHCLSPVKERIEFIKYHEYAEHELMWHLKILVKDSATLLQTTDQHQRTERDGRDDVAEPPSKGYPSLFL